MACKEKTILRQIRSRAKRNGIKFDLNEQNFPKQEFCSISGVRLDWTAVGPIKFNSPTVDRIDPTGDYVPSNCQWVCQRQNTLKNNSGLVDHLLRVRYMAKHLGVSEEASSILAEIDAIAKHKAPL